MATTPAAVQQLKFAILAVDVVLFRILDGTLQVLLGEVKNPYFADRLALIGGVVRFNQTAEEAAQRHLQTKAGIPQVYAEQLQTFSAVGRDPRGRVVSMAYLALTVGDPQKKEGTFRTQWVPVSKAKRLAYDHDAILRAALTRLQAKLGYTNIARFLLPPTFTLSELQRVYEIVLQKLLDKRNFRRKVLHVGFVAPTGKQTSRGTKKPAQLFTFAGRGLKQIEIL